LNNALFSPDQLGINQKIFLADRKYTVSGITKEKGS